jgi:hypothetical protein
MECVLLCFVEGRDVEPRCIRREPMGAVAKPAIMVCRGRRPGISLGAATAAVCGVVRNLRDRQDAIGIGGSHPLRRSCGCGIFVSFKRKIRGLGSSCCDPGPTPPLTSGNPITIRLAYPEGVSTCRLGMESTRPTVHIFRMDARFLEWFRHTFRENDPFFWHVVPANEGVCLWIQPIRPWLTLSVSPDWTDHRALLGYFNPILGQYVTTPLLTLLRHAHAVWQQAEQGGWSRRRFLSFWTR